MIGQSSIKDGITFYFYLIPFMARVIYIPDTERDRLFKNTLDDAKNGIRDHAILRLIFGLPIRLVEICRLQTSDLVDRDGQVVKNRINTIRKVVSFNDKERPMPILDIKLINSLQVWIDWRIKNGWGVNKTGYIDLNTPFFLIDENEGFQVKTIKKNGKVKQSTGPLNKLIRRIFKSNKIEGSLDSALRTWTTNMHHKEYSASAIWSYRGDAQLVTVTNIIKNEPRKFGAMVEKIY